MDFPEPNNIWEIFNKTYTKHVYGYYFNKFLWRIAKSCVCSTYQTYNLIYRLISKTFFK